MKYFVMWIIKLVTFLIFSTRYVVLGNEENNFIRGFCPPDHSFYNDKCYRFYRNAHVTFYVAEAACNQLNNGHVAAYHSEEDYIFLTSLVGGVTSGVWIGLQKESNNVFKFIDGSTYDYNVPGQNLGDGVDQACARLRGSDLEPADVECDHYGYKFLCQSDSLLKISATFGSDIKAEDVEEMFDGDPDTCADFSYNRKPIYFTIQDNSDSTGAMTLNVTYNQDVKCETARDLFIFTPDTECEMMKSCDVITSVFMTSSTCSFSCQCDPVNCDVTLVKTSEANICKVLI